ncbi:OLC1v1018076C1 [Oldenlandia corymbosa var. corymbosa]|uniref:OLC1v1018076C1 n=1 Tax=Oldenlandia corymbosa var. corymbosa TaxID=529605 RepID=A0AAV1EB02_OLDCO|nr:OLC1v1018076C1 [Oldenlandia corymbosa var. corymbosa]
MSRICRKILIYVESVENYLQQEEFESRKSMLLRSFSSSVVHKSSSVLQWERYPSMAVCFSPAFLSSLTTMNRGKKRVLRAPHLSLTAPFSSLNSEVSAEPGLTMPSKQGPLKPGLYLVGTPIGNLEDITLRALRVLRSANVILSEDTRHSGKLLQHYSISTPLLSYHKFNESQREQLVLKRLKNGEIVALISDAGTPGISDPGTELAMLCVSNGIDVVPIPGPSALVTALSASGLPTNEFTFVGFLPKHAGSRKERLTLSATEAATQIFYVPPHKLSLFLEELFAIFGPLRRCVMAREMTKVHEEFWRGTIDEAKQAFSENQPKGEITFLVEGKAASAEETPSESQLEKDLGEMISKGYSLSEAVKFVAAGTSVRRKAIYSIALRKFGKQLESEGE